MTLTYVWKREIRPTLKLSEAISKQSGFYLNGYMLIPFWCRPVLLTGCGLAILLPVVDLADATNTYVPTLVRALEGKAALSL